MILGLWKILFLSAWLVFKRPGAVAIDVTSRCNLRCRHCYWWKQEHPEELSYEEMVRLFHYLRAHGMRAAILYGGEPGLRLDVCRIAARIFDTLLVFTNGTLGLPDLGAGQWIVSLDGPKEINDRIRGKGVFDTVVENIGRAPCPPIVHMTISKLNEPFIEKFTETMLGLPVKGIGFSLFTPIKGANEQDLMVPVGQRGPIVKRLLALRQKYGERVGFTKAMARQLLPSGAFSSWNSYENCPVSQGLRCYRSDGTRKLCTYGNDADCARCGCAAVVVFRGAFYPPNYETMRLVFGLILPKFFPKTKR